ncbi:aldehyde dehydrogenase (NADP(+)) [Microbacterium rhizosphaerae]|uniref:Aldehyde dehydrogenase (NADP(+)) n=1 Tax=Microbacterium rhizosphaerae TaxID=1678237 RepID=A0ABZ0SN78_9MICO|nr:aldehyde dehydrogenase (NADP(+)) [Microbacterium rhizosphaerae]WPR89117.1 aldehyde dehydrogenase (NADP(+)) [Microbacterium rhizosphaerae]
MTATSTIEDVTAKVDAAVGAFDRLRRMSPAERAALLDAIAYALEANATTLVPLAQRESHLSPPRLTGELGRTTYQLRSFAQHLRTGDFAGVVIDHAKADTPLGPTPDLRRHLIPLGPVAVYSASNFPFAFSVAGGDTASALAAGCPVVVKAHSGHPELSAATTAIVQGALASAGAPDGTLDVVYGQNAGVSLLQNPRVSAGAFTGSTAGGRALFDVAAARPRPIPFYGELGSVNPVIVSREASGCRAEEIATGLVDSFTLGGGQFCTKPGVVFVPEGSAIPELARKAVRNAPAQQLLNDRITAAYTAAEPHFHAVPGVDTLVRGAATEEGVTPSLFRTPLASLLAHSDTLLEERFGPSAVLIEYPSDANLASLLDPFDGSLTVTIHALGADDAGVADALDRATLIAGRVVWNGWPTGVAVSPAMTHGGPYPSSTNALHTSVGVTAIRRFQRPVTFQNAPDALLPEPLRDAKPLV